MTSTDPLVERIRGSLAARDDVREVRMFGGLSFMVAEHLALAVRQSGDLLVSVNPAGHSDLLARGAEPAVMGNGRRMDGGWLTVPAALVPDNETLLFWIDIGIHSHANRGSRATAARAAPTPPRRSG